MTTPGKATLARRWLIVFTFRVLNRLQFFPLTLLHAILNAALHSVLSRRGMLVFRAGKVSRATKNLPRNLMLWLYGVADSAPGASFDVCLRLPREADDATMQDVLSVLLAHPGVRSVGLYWDSASMDDDLPFWGRRQEAVGTTIATTQIDNLDSPDVARFEELCRTNWGRLSIPVAVARDAQTMLKRQAGSGFVVCLNVPPELGSLAEAVALARPDIHLCDLSPPVPVRTRSDNIESHFGSGFTLHERMALVQAANAYVGSFDELGCAALVCGRPVILLGTANGNPPERPSGGNAAVWFAGQPELSVVIAAALELCSRYHRPLA